MSLREKPWRDEPVQRGRILVLSDNPISRSIAVIASTVGRTVLVESADDGGPGLDAHAGDAVVLCDHDAPDAPAVLRQHGHDVITVGSLAELPGVMAAS